MATVAASAGQGTVRHCRLSRRPRRACVPASSRQPRTPGVPSVVRAVANNVRAVANDERDGDVAVAATVSELESSVDVYAAQPSTSASASSAAPATASEQTLVGRFDVDDLLSAWIVMRFGYLWVVFGYLAVPIVASAQGVNPPSLLPRSELGAVLVCAETAKAGATVLMLQSELGAAGCLGTAAPWLRYRYHGGGGGGGGGKGDAASVTAGEDGWLSAEVGRGVGFGLAASVAARVVDGVVNGGGGGGEQAAAEGPLSLLSAGVGPALAVAAASLVVAPALEELFFRGFVLPAAARRLPAPLAVIATSALFAAVHCSAHDAPGLFAASAMFGAAAVAAGGGLVAPTVVGRRRLTAYKIRVESAYSYGFSA